MTEPIMTVSNSEIGTHSDCKRKWWLTYYEHMIRDSEPIDGIAAREAGTEAHAALEVYYATNSQVAALAVLNERRTAALASLEDEVQRKAWAMKVGDVAHAMIDGYFQWVEETGVDEQFECTAVESTILAESPVVGVHIRGKMDQELRHRSSGLYYVGDFKTTKDIERPIRLANLGIPQALTYAWIKRISEPAKTYAGGIWTILRQVKRGPTSKPPYFVRHMVRISQPDLDAHEMHLTGTLQDMLSTKQRLDAGENHNIVAPPNRSETCLWKCPFVDVCSFMNRPGATPDDLVEFGFHRGDPNERYAEADELASVSTTV